LRMQSRYKTEQVATITKSNHSICTRGRQQSSTVSRQNRNYLSFTCKDNLILANILYKMKKKKERGTIRIFSSNFDFSPLSLSLSLSLSLLLLPFFRSKAPTFPLLTKCYELLFFLQSSAFFMLLIFRSFNSILLFFLNTFSRTKNMILFYSGLKKVKKLLV
jgi:hypothetical protein